MIIAGAAIGIASRNLEFLPLLLKKYAGDICWAFSAYFLIRMVFVSYRPITILFLAFLLSILVELSQLIQSERLNSIRSTTIGALALGSGFLWSDILCYLAGVLIAFTFEIYLLKGLISSN